MIYIFIGILLSMQLTCLYYIFKVLVTFNDEIDNLYKVVSEIASNFRHNN